MEYIVYHKITTLTIFPTQLDYIHLIINQTHEPVWVIEQATDHQDQGWFHPGEMYLLPAEEKFTCEGHNELSFAWLKLSLSYLYEIAEQCGMTRLPKLVRQFRLRDPKLQELSSQTSEEMKEQVGAQLSVDALTKLLVIHLLHHYTTDN